MSVRESFRIICYSLGIRNTHFFVSFLSPYNVVVHCHGDNPSLELLGRRIRRLSLLTVEMLGRSPESSFSTNLLANRSEIFRGFLFVH